MPDYPLPTLGCTIDETGITAPSYDDILASLRASARSIFGSDVYIDSDSQDGQLLGIFALAQHEANQNQIAVFQSFSPTFAVGAGLSSIVKINGIAKGIATNSTVIVTIVGVAGTEINNGIVDDGTNQWALPALVTIPVGGSINVTATAIELGDIQAAAGTVVNLTTPTQGWQSVTNTADAVPGAPVESDAALRQRQALSTADPAQTILEAIAGGVAKLTGVSRSAVYQNDTGLVDANGIAAHSIAVVTEGGNITDITTLIARKKSPGTGTVGTISQVVVDQYGVPVTIRYYPLTEVTITIVIAATALPGYISTTGTAIINAIIAYINSLPIGTDVYHSQLVAIAQVSAGSGLAGTYNVTSVTASRTGSPGTADIVIAFNEAALTDAAHITLTVT